MVAEEQLKKTSTGRGTLIAMDPNNGEIIAMASAPTFDPNASIRRNVDALTMQRMRKDVTKGNAVTAMMEAKDFMGNLPTRLNRIMDAITNSELEVKIKAVDAKTMLDGMQKIANRITCGAIVGSLIVGAALLMRVETDFQMFGYPGLAILCFLSATLVGAYLVISIFVQDHKSRKKTSR